MKIKNGCFSWRPQQNEEQGNAICSGDGGVRERGDGQEAPVTMEENDHDRNIPSCPDGPNPGGVETAPGNPDCIQEGFLRLHNIDLEIKQVFKKGSFYYVNKCGRDWEWPMIIKSGLPFITTFRGSLGPPHHAHRGSF